MPRHGNFHTLLTTPRATDTSSASLGGRVEEQVQEYKLYDSVSYKQLIG